MTHRFRTLLPAAALLLPTLATAQWRCDCTTIVDSCTAEISLANEFVEVTSSTNQCARVDYFIDGRPFVSVVTEGRARQDFIPSSDSSVLVQSCQVCRDNAGATGGSAQDASGGAAATDNDALEPLIEVVPAYPEAAAAREASGFAEVEFTVQPSGQVEDVSVTASEPGDLFDDAAVTAVRRWRYPADPERSPRQVSQRLEFSPSMAAPAPRAAAGEDERGRPSGPANECVREDAVYDYGQMVEVGLMNTCSAPLAVYACAQGVGPRLGRWHCTDARPQRVLLVPRGDARAGDAVISSTGDGLGSFSYGEAFFLTRAPNTQYWWLGCGADDTACRAAGRDWIRAVDGQLASIDPRLRSPAQVSRSY